MGANISTPLRKLGSAVEKTDETTYQAETDGFIVSKPITSVSTRIKVDSFSPPTTSRSAQLIAISGVKGTSGYLVKKGLYWKTEGGTERVEWIPWS